MGTAILYYMKHLELLAWSVTLKPFQDYQNSSESDVFTVFKKKHEKDF